MGGEAADYSPGSAGDIYIYTNINRETTSE